MNTGLGGATVPSGLRIGLSLTHLAVVVATVGLPILLYAAGASAVTKLLYPTLALAFGALLVYRRSPWYVGLVIWVFAAAPLVRRLVDFQLGYDPSNPVLLAPYLTLVAAFPVAIQVLLGPRRGPRLSFALVLLAACYGLVIALFDERLTSGVVDALKWMATPLCSLALLSGRFTARESLAVATTTFVLTGAAMGAYGIAQFLEPQPWDVFWMENVDISSFGRPEPYEVRVFATMNSPGSLGIMLLAALFLLLRLPPLVAVVPAVLILGGLALAQYRAIWAATAIGLLLIAALGSARNRLTIAAAGAVLVLIVSVVGVSPDIRDTIIDRMASLTDLQSDASGEDRLNQYAEFLDEQTFIGEGLALNAGTRALDGKPGVVIDSAFIEILRALGMVGGPLFLLGLTGIALSALRSTSLGPGGLILKAIVVATVVQLPFGSVHVGENGLPFWIAVGLLLAATERARREASGRPTHAYARNDIRPNRARRLG